MALADPRRAGGYGGGYGMGRYGGGYDNYNLGMGGGYGMGRFCKLASRPAFCHSPFLIHPAAPLRPSSPPP